MSEGAFDGLYKAKLRDNGIEYSEDDYKRFCRQLNRSFSKGILDLSSQRIGINILTKLTKVLRAAALTYVAGVLTSVMNLMYLLNRD